MKRTSVHLPPETLDRIDKLGNRLNLTQSEMIRNLLQIALDDVEALDRLGVLKAATSLRDFAEWFKTGKQHKMTEGHTF